MLEQRISLYCLPLIGFCKTVKLIKKIYQNSEFVFLCFLSDRFRTTSNVLDDCFAAAVIEKLSKKDLTEMDLNKKGVPDSDHHKLLKTV